MRLLSPRRLALVATIPLALVAAAGAYAASEGAAAAFPPPLESYTGEEGMSLARVLEARVRAEPLNLVAALLFLGAIVHTFLAPRIAAYAHRLEHRAVHDDDRDGIIGPDERPLDARSFRAEMLHFLGEIEAVFGVWVVPLLVTITFSKGWPIAEGFIHNGVQYTEPLFVVVVMSIASTRPVLQVAEAAIGWLARLGGDDPRSWWLSILVVGPLLGSLITEPAAMVICSLLLARRFFDLRPTARFRYATLGLLFVNISVGGTLTHFAAPPVLMVAGRWGWGLRHMATEFGWKAGIGILFSTLAYALVFRRELAALAGRRAESDAATDSRIPVPAWVVGTHLGFVTWTVLTAHTPALFIGGFLFFLAFFQATAPHQDELNLRSPLLVGFFLGGLVTHGALQQWWIAPVLGRLGELPLFFGAAALTAFNDNAAITYLATLVPDFSEPLRYAVVAGAVAGGGLTVIANAPNPAGQALLARYFDNGISPLGLLLGALAPTAIVSAVFLLFA